MITEKEMDNYPSIKQIIYYFQELDKIPRGSKNEKQVVEYLVNFAKERNLNYYTDDANNIVICKNGTDNSDNYIAFQSHTDMVCEKKIVSNHNFLKDPIDLVIDGNYIKSNETSIGADNGIGVAYMLTILNSKDIIHPNIEMIFTSDEESSMTGAKKIDLSKLKSKRIISLDAFNENTIIYGCASNYSRVLKFSEKLENITSSGNTFSIEINGFLGGHSGIDIDKGRGNPIISMATIINELQNLDKDLVINSIDSGTWVTAIPRNAKCVVTSSKLDTKIIKTIIKSYETLFKKQYNNDEITIKLSKEKNAEKGFNNKTSNKIVNYILNFPNGVLMTNKDNDVILSTNIGTAFIDNDCLIVENSIRSNLKGSKTDTIVHKIENYDEKSGFITTQIFDFPGYKQEKDSDFIIFLSDIYKKIYNRAPKLKQEHIFLEGSWFAKKVNNLEYISISPNIYYAHSSNEMVSLSSIEKMWEYIKSALENYERDLKNKNGKTRYKK